MNNIIKSLKEALKQILLTKFIFGSIGSLLAAFYLPKSVFGCSDMDSIIYSLVVFLIWYIIVFAYRLWENYKVWFSNHYFDNIWGEGIILLKTVNDEREMVLNKQQSPHKAIKKVCNELKKYYDKKTKQICSVSVKVPKDPEALLEDMIVENICRDDSSAKIRNTEAYYSQVHQLFGNTAYNTIVSKMYKKKHKAFYLNNHVDKDDNYETTSWDAYSETGLPYKSEFVFPITNLPIELTKGPSEICGFLCIDCKEENAFQDDRYSVQLMKCIASNLNSIIVSINENNKS